MTEKEVLRMRTKNYALDRAAEMFRFYESQHLKKTPPQEDKAKVNNELANMCEYASTL